MHAASELQAADPHPRHLEGEGEARCLQSARSLLDATKSYSLDLNVNVTSLLKSNH